MGAVARVAGAVGLGVGTVVPVLIGSPWPFIVLGGAIALVPSALAAVVITAAVSRSRGRQARAVLERLAALMISLRWPPPDSWTARAGAPPAQPPPDPEPPVRD